MFYNKKANKRNNGNRFLYFLISCIIIVALLLAVEGGFIKNTIGGEQLFWYSGFCGLGIALLCAVLLKRLKPTVYEDKNQRNSILTALFMVWFFFTPVVVSFINRMLSNAPITCSQYSILSKSTGGSRYTEYCLLVDVNGEREQFTVSEEVYKSMVAPGSVQLCTQKGVIGYEVVREFKPVK